MKKEDLKSGMVVKLRNGQLGLVIEHDGVLRMAFSDGFINVSDLDNNLMENGCLRKFDVINVGLIPAGNLLNIDESCVTVTWTRKEAKKMTLSEIEKELGYEIEIILD